MFTLFDVTDSPEYPQMPINFGLNPLSLYNHLNNTLQTSSRAASIKYLWLYNLSKFVKHTGSKYESFNPFSGPDLLGL